MTINKSILITLLALCSFSTQAGSLEPVHLMTDLMEHTDRVFLDGYPTETTLAELDRLIESYQFAAITNEHPDFGWEIQSDRQNTLQTAYRILVATDKALVHEGKADIWDSGKTPGEETNNIKCGGIALQPNTNYYWAVKIWDNHGRESTYSATKSFRTAPMLDHTCPYYPLQKTDEYPVCIKRLTSGSQLIDFGKAAFGTISLTLTGTSDNDTVNIHFGEALKEDGVDRKPGGSIRYTRYSLPLIQGTHTYHIKINPDSRNTDPKANESGVTPVYMPSYIGEVYPFRYCELENYERPVSSTQIHRTSVHYLWNDSASRFSCSDEILNQVWNLSKHTIKATSFAGIYVDGDRERIPYEADAYINQLGHYCTDREYSMARRTLDWLIEYPTWPTEWIMQAPLMAWNEYMFTGNTQLLAKHYERLKARTLRGLRQSNGLISTRIGGQSPEFLASIGYRGRQIRDIVDWPQSGAAGIEKKEEGEADGYNLTEYNTVVNAYHCQSLRILADIAEILDRQEDARMLSGEAEEATRKLNQLLLDRQYGYYKDGLTSTHHSLHANIFPLTFNLYPAESKADILEFIHSRGMACSVYGSQFLMDALYDAEDADYALSLLSSQSSRSWYNMIRLGSTIALEAWDAKFKPNLDWNHAWGAAPANIIPRKLMGIEPIQPGFRKMRIKPQPSNLTWAKADIPTIKGTVSLDFENNQGNSFKLHVTIPAGTEAEVWMPRLTKKGYATINGKSVKGTISGNFVIFTLGSGEYTLSCGPKTL